MRWSSAALFALALWFSPRSTAECVQAGGVYEGFRVTRVSVETPLGFPIHWIQQGLLGPAIDSLRSVATSLPIKKGEIFHLADHIGAIGQLSQRFTNAALPGERIKVAAVFPRFTTCNMTARTVEIAYRVYSTDAAYFASRLLESARILPDRSLMVGEASERQGKVLVVPYAGYDRSSRAFGGIKASWIGRGTLLNSIEIEAGGSSSSHRTGL